MLWKISYQFASLIEAPPSIAEARKMVIGKIVADPGAVISKIETAEPTCPSLLKRVVGLG